MDHQDQPPATEPLRLTYAQLAARLGISNDAARQLVRRRRWPRIRPNHPGQPAVALVPEDELAGERWRIEDDPSNRALDRPSPAAPTGDDRLLIAQAVAALEAAVMTMTVELAAERSRADRAEQGRDAERGRADLLRERIEALQAELAVLRAADPPRRPWWRRWRR